MSTVDRRRQELEEKKRKLADMKKAREERMALLSAATAGIGQNASTGGDTVRSATPLTAAGRKDIDDLVNTLLGPSSTASNTTRPTTPSGGVGSNNGLRSSSATSSLGQQDAGTISGSAGWSKGVNPLPGVRGGAGGVAGMKHTQTDRGMGDGESHASSMPSTPVQEMLDTQIELYELPTKPSITYSRGVQTADSSTQSGSNGYSYLDSDGNDPDREMNGRETEGQMRARLQAEFEVEKERLEREIRAEEDQRRIDEARIIELSDEEKKLILQAQEFTRFMEDSSKIIQRALNDQYDYVKDYRVTADDDDDETDGKSMKLVCTFSDDRWTQGRSVTALEWSPKFPELCAAAYNRNPKAPNDPSGIVAIWNLHLLERPEFVFHAQSDVLSIAFSPFHPNLLFGGTYSGQVLLWDTRAKSLPVLKTPSSGSGHRYPIYGMRVVGSPNAHNLVTSSTDGTVCGWLADMLAQPQECLELTHPGQRKTNELAITCLDFPDNESSTFWIGTEEGDVYQANRFDRAGVKAGMDPQAVYRGHAAPVTGIDFHPLRGAIDFSDLFLTSSMDWSVKLWRAGATNKPGAMTGPISRPLGGDITPIRSFDENDDYVQDVKWHSQHPAVFGTGDGLGTFEVWNLNQDVESPALSANIGNGNGINKIAWEKKEGRKAAVGATDGVVYVYDVGDLATPQESDWSDFQRNVQEMLQKQTGSGSGGGVSSSRLPSHGR